MKKKYPTFERVTAGRLVVGNVVLIREGTDTHSIEGTRFPNATLLPPGVYTVANIESELHPAGRKMSRYYRMHLVSEDGFTTYVPTTFSSVQRWNRVVPNG